MVEGSANCMICVILWSYTPNLSSSINLVITKYELKSQYVKLTQLWHLNVKCVLSLIWQACHKIVKICFHCTYVEQMIIQQRFNVLLQLQFYNVFINVLSINKNDSPNKPIIVKKSRQTDQNDKSCKNHLSFWSVYLDFLTMISLFILSFLLFVLKLSTGTKFLSITSKSFQ